MLLPEDTPRKVQEQPTYPLRAAADTLASTPASPRQTRSRKPGLRAAACLMMSVTEPLSGPEEDALPGTSVPSAEPSTQEPQAPALETGPGKAKPPELSQSLSDSEQEPASGPGTNVESSAPSDAATP